MKSTQLRQRLTELKVRGVDLEIIKDANLLAIKGGQCPRLQSCGTYVSCEGKYKSGDKEASIDVII